MKKAAIQVPGVMFQDMLKLPFGVAIEEIVYDKDKEEFTVIIFGERMEELAETDGKTVRVATYEISPLWHKGRITLTDEVINWPMNPVKEKLKKEAVDPLKEKSENESSVEVTEEDDGVKENEEQKQKPESGTARKKPGRKRKS